MSRNTGCQGSIYIPKKEFSKTCKAIVNYYNEGVKQDLEILNQAVVDFLETQKGKRNVNWEHAFNNYLYNRFVENSRQKFTVLDPQIFGYAATRQIVDGNVTYGKPKKIKKHSVKMTTESNIVTMSFLGENSISISKKTAAIGVYVSYNNRSLEEAVENPFFKHVMRTLSEVKYTKDTGGEIIGKEEGDEEDESHKYVMYEFNNKPKQTLSQRSNFGGYGY